MAVLLRRGEWQGKDISMRTEQQILLSAFAFILMIASAGSWVAPQFTGEIARASSTTPIVAVGPQYDTTHVYVAPEDFDRFVASVVATFGGTTSKQVVTNVAPTPSSTISQLILTPSGSISA